MSTKKELVVITDLTPEKIAYFDGLEKKQLEIVEANPLIEVVDKENYNEAKKRRTTLKSASTTIEKEAATTKKFLNAFKTNVDNEFNKHSLITREACEKQQAAIDVYEKAIQEEKDRKAREKEEADRRIKDSIVEIISGYENQIGLITYENQNNVREDIEKSITERTGTFGDFDIIFDTHVEKVKSDLYSKINAVQDDYIRRENERKSNIQSAISQKVHSIESLMFNLNTDNLESSASEVNSNDSFDYMEFTDEMNTKVNDAKKRFFDHYEKVKVDAEKERNEKRIQIHKDNLENYRQDFLEGTSDITVDNYTQATVWIAKVNNSFDQYDWQEFADKYESLKQEMKTDLEERISKVIEDHNKEQEIIQLRKDKLMSDRVAEIHQLENLDRESQSYKWAKTYEFSMLRDYSDEEYSEFIKKIIAAEIEEKEVVLENEPVQDSENVQQVEYEDVEYEGDLKYTEWQEVKSFKELNDYLSTLLIYAEKDLPIKVLGKKIYFRHSMENGEIKDVEMSIIDDMA